MDGNGRWAQNRALPRLSGHAAGKDNMIRLIARARSAGISCLTLFALSTENVAARPKDELQGILTLIYDFFKEEVKALSSDGINVRVIGDISVFPNGLKSLLAPYAGVTEGNDNFTLAFALNYGSRAEIVLAVRLLSESGSAISEKSLKNHLYTADIPDPDLIIRTGGEVRLSNFLLFQAAYAELYFTPVLFPDFNEEEFDKALAEFANRQRRYGGL